MLNDIVILNDSVARFPYVPPPHVSCSLFCLWLWRGYIKDIFPILLIGSKKLRYIAKIIIALRSNQKKCTSVFTYNMALKCMLEPPYNIEYVKEDTPIIC